MRPTAALLLLLLANACASPSGPVQPLPFPGAAPAPAAPTPVPVAPVPGTPALPPPAPPPSAAPVSAAATAQAIVDTALGYRGVRYLWGGADPETGFDCSGFVQYVFAQHAIQVARLVPDEYRQGLPVRLGDLEPGDLVFFSTTGPGPTHVGIAVSRDQFVHAPSSKGVVRVEAVDSPYWHARFLGARRLVGNRSN